MTTHPDPSPRNRAKGLFRALIVLVLLTGAGAAVWHWKPWETRPAIVTVEVLATGPAARVLAVNGRVAALNTVDIRPAVTGQIIEIAADENDVVAAGQTLARIDDAQARSERDQAQAALDAGRVRLAQAQATLDRARALGTNVSRSTLEDAELAASLAEDEIERLSAAVAQAESRLAAYTLTAPFAGTVIARTVEPGAMIDQQTVLFTIADLTTLVVETDIDEIYAAQIATGLAARLQPAGMSQTLTGHVSFAAPRIDPTTGGRLVRLDFDAPRDLPVGLTVAVNIIVAEDPAALTIPREAMLSDGNGTFVLVDRGGIAVRLPVEVIEWPADRLIVTRGLAAGDRLILTPVPEGTPVRVAGP